jgi:glycosyltransferase involved in cell wall biosynthesis
MSNLGYTPVRASDPLVSVLIPTRDRPDFLPTALECWRRQTYPNRQVIVLDHGLHCPVDLETVIRAGAMLVRIPPSLTLGEALNAGVKLAAGPICLKADDDDWYGPSFLSEWMDQFVPAWEDGNRRVLLCATTYLLFDVRRWDIRLGEPERYSGATLCFGREAALEVPFRPYRRYEDTNFYVDQVRVAGAMPVYVGRPTSYLAVRHDGLTGNRGHTWTDDRGVHVADWLSERPIVPIAPDDLIAEWVTPVYRKIQAWIEQHVPEPVEPDKMNTT